MRKLTSLALLVTLVATVGVPVTCAGWEARAADRMACCQRAHHAECDDQAAADNCCARQEQAQHVTSVLVKASPAASPVPGLIAASFGGADVPPSPLARVHHLHSRPMHDPPNLSPPPLRI